MVGTLKTWEVDYKAILRQITETPESEDKSSPYSYSPQPYSLDVTNRSPMHRRLRPRNTTCRSGSDPTSEGDQGSPPTTDDESSPLDTPTRSQGVPRGKRGSEASGVSGVSGVVLRPAQVLPRVEARDVHFVRSYACKDWLEEDRLTGGARICRTTARKGIVAIGISLMVRNFGCSWVTSCGGTEVTRANRWGCRVLEELFLRSR